MGFYCHSWSGKTRGPNNYCLLVVWVYLNAYGILILYYCSLRLLAFYLSLELDLRESHDLVLCVLSKLHLLKLINILLKSAHRCSIFCIFTLLLLELKVIKLLTLFYIQLRSAEVLFLVEAGGDRYFAVFVYLMSTGLHFDEWKGSLIGITFCILDDLVIVVTFCPAQGWITGNNYPLTYTNLPA